MKAAIIGVGWLGEQIADFLLEKQFELIGTTTSDDKVVNLNSKGIRAVQYDLISKPLSATVMAEIAQSEWIIFTVPPSNFGNTYAAHCIRFFEQLQTYAIEGTLIYTSSTSLYGNQASSVDENSAVDPQSENAKQIKIVEDFLFQRFEKLSVWRMGGLVGPNRHPIHFIAGREGVSKPRAAINLIHSADILQLLNHFIEEHWTYRLLNVCSPIHPSKKEYYTQVAKNLNKSVPTFDDQDKREGKTIESRFLNSANFQFNFPSPYEYPEAIK